MEEKFKEFLGCFCGGGDECWEYSDCCVCYYGGVVELDVFIFMSMSFMLIFMNVNVIVMLFFLIYLKMY